MNDIIIRTSQILQSHLIDIIGEAVEHQSNQVRRLAAKEIIKRDDIIYFPKSSQDIMMAAVVIGDLNYRLASASNYFAGELLRMEEEPYAADGILFPALVHLVRIEQDLFAWQWLPEQVRALGLAINRGENVAWPITQDYVTIQDAEGNCRQCYRLSS